MKVFMRGNTGIIKTAIKEEDFNKYQKFDCFTVTDEDDNMVYALSKGAVGNINSFSMQCNSVYQGNLALSLVFEGETEEFVDAIKPALVSLKNAEEDMLAAIDRIKDMLESVEEDITVE